MSKCDECRKEFATGDMIDCPLEDEACKVCEKCCGKCGYNVDGECTFLD